MNDSVSPGAFRILPPVVKTLLILNCLMFLARMAASNIFHIDLNDYLGLHYWGSSRFNPVQFLTYMFMHANFMHLFFNMFALWMFGSAIENTFGKNRFIAYYLITGIGAGLMHYIIIFFQLSDFLAMINQCIDEPTLQNLEVLRKSHTFINTNEIGDVNESFALFRQAYRTFALDPTNSQAAARISSSLADYKDFYISLPNVVGASGSVYGLLLAFGMLFPNATIYIYFLLPLKAKWFVAIYAGLELYFGVTGTSDGVAHFAHLGGMLFGLLLILYWRKKDRERQNNPFYRSF